MDCAVYHLEAAFNCDKAAGRTRLCLICYPSRVTGVRLTIRCRSTS